MKAVMNTDKAYVLGLIVGGGKFGKDMKSFAIRLPYKKWGSTENSPARASVIQKDIESLGNRMQAMYGISARAESFANEWLVSCSGNLAPLLQDMQSFGLNPSSKMVVTADLSGLLQSFGKDDFLKKRFLSGLADTIGSMVPSHRKFSNDKQVISFEIPGFNYRLVCQICTLLYAVGCPPTQVEWQHPNFQCGKDSYDRKWKKGNKLRVLLDPYMMTGSLAFACKAEAAAGNQALQSGEEANQALPCEEQGASQIRLSAVHCDEGCIDIPSDVRGGHYLCARHLCAALGCSHAPYKDISDALKKPEEAVMPFAVLSKGTDAEIRSIMKADPLMAARAYTVLNVSVAELVEAGNKGMRTANFRDGVPVFSKDKDKGYPVNELVNAVVYILAGAGNQLHGKRPPAKDSVLNPALKRNPALSVRMEAPDLLTPVLVTDGRLAAMVGPLNSAAYRKLFSLAPDNKYKLLVRPVREEDLR